MSKSVFGMLLVVSALVGCESGEERDQSKSPEIKAEKRTPEIKRTPAASPPQSQTVTPPATPEVMSEPIAATTQSIAAQAAVADEVAPDDRTNIATLSKLAAAIDPVSSDSIRIQSDQMMQALDSIVESMRGGAYPGANVQAVEESYEALNKALSRARAAKDTSVAQKELETANTHLQVLEAQLGKPK